MDKLLECVRVGKKLHEDKSSSYSKVVDSIVSHIESNGGFPVDYIWGGHYSGGQVRFNSADDVRAYFKPSTSKFTAGDGRDFSIVTNTVGKITYRDKSPVDASDADKALVDEVIRYVQSSLSCTDEVGEGIGKIRGSYRSGEFEQQDNEIDAFIKFLKSHEYSKKKSYFNDKSVRYVNNGVEVNIIDKGAPNVEVLISWDFSKSKVS